ncbi:thioredoxin family protein [Cytophagaceae bacterium ABcell3]|nr:thioredoxin family protein [Cytophagaceae bacterium ABcell3]
MKHLFTIIAPLLIFSTAFIPQEKSINEGIKFHTSSWEEVQELASKEGKPIFIDLYASWCGVCRSLKEKTFSDAKAAEFFNTNYINYAVDGESKEGKKLLEKYILTDEEDPRMKFRQYPQLLILDQAGNLVQKHNGFLSAEELIELGNIKNSH